MTKPGRTLLPVLIILFLVSYGLLTMLVVEQARTIDSQRGLIGLLFDDSVQLATLSIESDFINKMPTARAHAQGEAQSHAKGPSAQVSPQDSQVQHPPISGYSIVGCQESWHQQNAQTPSFQAAQGRV